MRARSVRVLLTTLACTVIAACAGPPPPTPVPTPTPAAAPEPPMPVETVPRGRAQIIVNGDSGPTGPVVCSDANGLTTITIGDTSLGVSVIVTDDEVPAVRSVTIGDVGGVALAYSSAVTGARVPGVRRNGATLIVSGAGSGTDSAHPARIVDAGYQIAVACP